jgi:hypothetical protein
MECDLSLFLRRLIMKEKKGIILTGAIIGLLAVLLVKFGNPANMGMCVA